MGQPTQIPVHRPLPLLGLLESEPCYPLRRCFFIYRHVSRVSPSLAPGHAHLSPTLARLHPQGREQDPSALRGWHLTITDSGHCLHHEDLGHNAARGLSVGQGTLQEADQTAGQVTPPCAPRLGQATKRCAKLRLHVSGRLLVVGYADCSWSVTGASCSSTNASCMRPVTDNLPDGKVCTTRPTSMMASRQLS